MWQRKLVLVFGASAHATTAILTAFFVGLALGSLIGGRILNRYKSPIQFYACCELFIAISALLFPFLLTISNNIYLALHHGASDHDQSFFYQKFCLTIFTILPATIAMGATIPAISKIINQHIASIGNSVSIAYGCNTLGAVAGTLLCGLYLLPTIGITNTLHFALVINITVAIAAMILSYRCEKHQLSESTSDQTSNLHHHKFEIFVYFMMGFIALSYQIVWLRMMAIFGNNSVITFICTLTIYLAGFALGSMVLFRQLSKRMDSKKIFFISIFGLSLSVLLLFPFYYQIYKITAFLREVIQGRFLLFRLEIVIAAIVMFFPTLMMGLSFPAICDIISNRKNLAKNSGLLYFVGNLGSAFGVSIFGLYIIHSFGLINSLFILVNLGFVLSIFMIVKSEYLPKKKKIYFIAGTLIGIILIANYAKSALPFFRWDKSIEVDGELFQVDLKAGITSKILRYKTGKVSTIMIKQRSDGWRSISVDDQPVASTRPDAVVDSKMLAHLPLLLHPNPKNALTVGFGSGGTSWSLTQHDIDAWAVEIEQEVIQSADLFPMQNHNVLAENNFNLVVDDARSFLYVTDKKFDVISTDVTNIQYKQNASLYTKEYFELMKSKLTDNGVACAWIPMSGLSDADFKTLLKTFGTVYPNASLWVFDHMKTYYGVLIGTPVELMVTKKRLKEFFANPKIKDDLAKINITQSLQFKGFLHLAGDDYDRFVSDAVFIHTDDKPILEFTSLHHWNGGAKEFKHRIEQMKNYEPKNPDLYFE